MHISNDRKMSPQKKKQFIDDIDTLVAEHQGEEANLLEAIRDFLSKRAADYDWEKDIVPADPKTGYGRLQVAVGEKSNLELVLVYVPRDGGIQKHSHCGWAVVHIVKGIENNIFYKDQGDGKLIETGANSFNAGDTVIIERDVHHSISSPTADGSISLHVYDQAQDKICGAEFF